MAADSNQESEAEALANTQSSDEEKGNEGEKPSEEEVSAHQQDSQGEVTEGESLEHEREFSAALGHSAQIILPTFVSARSLVAEDILRKDCFLSPRFRSAAARAGWDDEALLIATEEGDPGFSLVKEEEIGPVEARSPAFLEKSPQYDNTRGVRDKKREERTPQLAATPLSAGRRHRRARRHAIHGCSPEALPIGDLSLTDEFQNGITQARQKEQNLGAGGQDVLEKGAASSSAVQVDAKSETTHQKPACLDQLREELSCAICLDMCYEPSTTSCGHSFCRGCMQSVLQKCGLRCPKCRQHLKGDIWRSCPVNVVLWNTIQLLFPTEVQAKREALVCPEKAKDVQDDQDNEHNASRSLSNGASTTAVAWQHARPPSAGLRRRGIGRRIVQMPNRQAERGSTSAETADGDVVVRQRQVLADAAFARQLQMHLMSRGSSGTRTTTNAATNVASAAANLRAVATRAVRHRARHY